MGRRTMTLRNKLLVAMAAILLISLLAIGSGVSIYVARSEEAAWQSRQMAGARQAALVVETFLEKAQSALLLLGLFDRSDLVEHPEHLEDVLRQYPSLLEVVRLDTNGEVIAAAYLDDQVLGGSFPVILANWFQTARAGHAYIGNIQFSVQNHPYVIMALPGQDGEVLAARLAMELLWGLVGDLHFTPTSKAYIFDHDGRLLAHTVEATVAAHKTIAGRPEYQSILQSPDYSWYGPYVNLDGGQVYGASMGLAGTDWIIVTEVMHGEVFSVSRSALLMLGGGMFIFAIAVMLLTGDVLQIFIFTPISALYKGAQRIGSGELEHRITISHKTEISQVAAAFNDMAARLQERDAQIQARSIALADEIAQRQRAELALLQANEDLESKVAERTKSLSALQARLEHLLTSNAAVIYSINLAGQPKPTYFSPNVEVLTGYDVDEILQTSSFWVEQLHPEDHTRFPDMAAALQKSGHEIFDYRFLCKDGEYRWIRDEARVVFNQEGNEPEIIGTLIDINTRKLAEQELRRARDEALQASRLKSQFVATMSHEIRTPMNGILGMAELLSTSTLDKEQREWVDTVRTSANALVTVINDILDFSKIETNRVELQASDFVLQSAVEEVADLLAIRAREKKLVLMTFVAPELPAVVRGDPMRVRQVLLNLLGNAVKFTAKGEVVVRAEAEPSADGRASDKPGDTIKVRFSITDTGSGIAREDQARLFQPFVQVDGSHSRQYGGTGLGLVISKRLVELMGGTIGVETTAGHGSTFWFTIEFEHGKGKAPLLTTDLHHLRGERVLVVSSVAQHAIIQRYLALWDIHTEYAASADAAMLSLRNALDNAHPYQAVLLDSPLAEDALAGAKSGAKQQNLLEFIQQKPLQYTMRLALMGDSAEAHFDRFVSLIPNLAILHKPLRQAHLFGLLQRQAQGQLQVERAASTTPSIVAAEARTISQIDHYAAPASQILLVEDNLVNQKVASQQLKRMGYHVEIANDGQEALDKLSARVYNLILMDCQMPRVDGFTATRLIRQREAVHGGHIPIIAMTANALEGDRDACLQAGMDDYMAKPVRIDQLREMVEHWLTVATPD